MAKKHEPEAIRAGYNSIEDMIYDVCQNFDSICKRPLKEGQKRDTYILVKFGNKEQNVKIAVSPIYFELQEDGKGGYYVIVTSIPKGDRSLRKELQKETLVYSRPGLDSAATSNGSAVSTQGNNSVGVTQGRLPTSDTTSVSATSVTFSDNNVKETTTPKTNSVGKKITAKSGKTAIVITDSGKELHVTYKLSRKVKDFLNKIKSLFFGEDNVGNIFRKLESDQAWEQSGKVDSSRSFFSLLPRTIQQELEARGKAFRQAVEDVKEGVRNGREIFAVCDTSLLLQKIGMQNLPIKMSLGIAYNNTRPRSSGAKHAHEVPFEVFEQIPKAIQDTVFIMESATVPGDIVIYTDIKVGKKSILVPLTLSKTVGRNQGNYIKSIYPRNNEAGFITKQAIEGRLLYVNSKKSSTWLGKSRVQFPQKLTKSSSLLEDSVSKELEKVNKNSAKIYYSVAPDNHKIADAFTNTERKGVIDSVKDFFKEHKKTLYTDWIDKNNPLKGFDALTETFGGLSVYDQVQSLPATTAGMLKAICEGDVHMIKAANQHLKKVKMKHNVTLAMALEKITKKTMDQKYKTYLKENGFDNWVNAFGAYLGVERCLEMAELARAEGKVYKFPKGLTESECREFSKNVPQEFREAADIFYKVNDNIISVMSWE